MGWQDAPVLSEETTSPAMGQAFNAAPEVNAAPAATPEPSMGDVAMNAVPKGIANLLNTPMTLASLIMHGLANLPGAGHLSGLQEAAQNPTLNSNAPMDVATKMGLVDPAKNPQTGPQRIVDTAIQAAIGAAAIPGGGMAGALKGAAVGAASGAAAQTTKEATGSDLLAVAVGVAAPFAMSGLGKAATTIGPASRQQTLKDARAVGYVVEPSSIKQSAVGSKIESIGGKAAIAQNAAVRNQEITNTLAVKALGLPEGTPLSMPLLNAVRDKAALPYQEVEALRASQTNLPWFPRFHSTSLLDELKQARADTTALYRQYDRAADPAILKAAKASGQTVQSIESDIEMIANASGKPELVGQLKAARQLYARTYDIERALNLGDGNISAPIIGRMLDQGRPLSGELKMIGRFAQAFPRVAREAASLPPSGVSGVDAASSAMLSTAGFGAAGPAGLIAGGAPLVRGPARNLVLSEKYQNSLTKPPPTPTPIRETAARAGMVGKTQAQEGLETP